MEQIKIKIEGDISRLVWSFRNAYTAVPDPTRAFSFEEVHVVCGLFHEYWNTIDSVGLLKHIISPDDTGELEDYIHSASGCSVRFRFDEEQFKRWYARDEDALGLQVRLAIEGGEMWRRR
jgi:hypothetical protein